MIKAEKIIPARPPVVFIESNQTTPDASKPPLVQQAFKFKLFATLCKALKRLVKVLDQLSGRREREKARPWPLTLLAPPAGHGQWNSSAARKRYSSLASSPTKQRSNHTGLVFGPIDKWRRVEKPHQVLCDGELTSSLPPPRDFTPINQWLEDHLGIAQQYGVLEL